MSTVTIADAERHIEELSAALDCAYWEASNIERKDLIYSIITLLNSESTEISKLSIQDHHLPYEPISKDFYDLKQRLNQLSKNMDEVVIRSVTAKELLRLIPTIASMII